jgi:hypothetical protein
MGYPWFTTLQLGVAGMIRNRRPDKIGMGGRFAPESVAGMVRNTHTSAIL